MPTLHEKARFILTPQIDPDDYQKEIAWWVEYFKRTFSYSPTQIYLHPSIAPEPIGINGIMVTVDSKQDETRVTIS